MAMRCLLLGLLVFPVVAHAAQCTARSGPGTAALVELYTSEGCSSCPPADRWLSTLSSRPSSSVVPLALHVDYWDYIGWKDPYARREFSLRQRKFTQLQRMAFVYTPQVMLQGRDFRGWGSAAFEDAVARINAQPARASLKLAILGADAHGVQVEVGAELVQGSAAADLYLAAYQNRLQSRVNAGENRGRLLTHDYVVLQWEGPFALPGGRLVERRKLALLPGAAPAHSGVAAFVQDRRTGEVLQALLRSSC
jgi:hypothetical protein